jgi:hypothetical protein
VIKITIYFNQSSAGFSETFYANGSDPYVLANSLTPAFYQRAVQFRAANTYCVGARFSSTDPPRESVLIRPQPQPHGIPRFTTIAEPDVVSTTAVFLLGSTLPAQRRLYMRGIADMDVNRDENGQDLPSPFLINGSNTYFEALNLAGFSIKKQLRPPAGGLVWDYVTKVEASTLNPSKWTEFTLDSGVHNVFKGDTVTFNGITTLEPGLPSKALVINDSQVGTKWVFTIAWPLPGGVILYPEKLKAVVSEPDLGLISTWSFERFSEHKTGRPFGSLRGRARKA